MDRCKAAMRSQLPEFLLCSLLKELCTALLCPEKMHDRNPERRMQ